MAAPGERAVAMAEGRKVYFTGRPCKNGHTAERKTVSGHCIVCHTETQLRWDQRNREQRNALRTRRYSEDPEFAERCRENQRASYLKIVATPKETISLVAHEGTHEANTARTWVREQARRLGVTVEFITNAVRLGWTLVEIEKMFRCDAELLADHVGKHKREDGFDRWEDFNPILIEGYLD